MEEVILKELQEIKKLLQVIVNNQEQRTNTIYLGSESVDPTKIPSIDEILSANSGIRMDLLFDVE